MSEEALIPKMRRIDPEKKKVKIPFTNIGLIVLAVILLICSTFLNINLQHYTIPSNIFTNNTNAEDFIYSFFIIPQVPVLMFICSALGKKMATISVFFYILCGLFFLPIFALGGGIRYIGEYSFGYLLAFIPAVVIAGSFLNKKYSFPNMIIASILGVLIIHTFGILYMVLIALIRHDSGSFITGWIGAQSGLKIIYDIVFSFVFILIGKYVNSFFKFTLE